MLPTWYTDYKNLIEESLFSYLDKYLDKKVSKPLEEFKEVIKYSVKWWKRIRAILALEFYLIFSGKDFKDLTKDSDIIKFCIAIEAIHAFSLIHDDLPCMDNDTLRRWEPTVWKKYWEYQAVLVWDLLNTLTFEILSEIKKPEISQKLVKLLSKSIWFHWMIGGQVEDLYFEEKSEELDLKILKELHKKKTWALIRASIVGWMILSKISPDTPLFRKEVDNSESILDVYDKFWKKLWLAFQIRDDLLDIDWTPEETGKSVWWENKGFVYFMWEEKTREKLDNLIKKCRKMAKNLSSEKIDFIVDYIEKRNK